MTQPYEPPPGRVAAIDYGTVRLGIAISDARRTIASPLESYTRQNPERDAKRLRQLAADEAVTLFVVGLPIHLDGNESQKSFEARQFADWLHQVTGIPVQLFDERFSTHQAGQWLAGADLTSKKRKKRIDMVAAQVILAAFLESSTRPTNPGSIDDTPR